MSAAVRDAILAPPPPGLEVRRCDVCEVRSVESWDGDRHRPPCAYFGDNRWPAKLLPDGVTPRAPVTEKASKR